jgi:endonuclease/exonuclease/phosphatase family metal-dependent hydrolase
LIGLQEVLRGERLDQLSELLGDRGYHLDFVKAVDFWNDRSLGFGNAVASRWPIGDREVLRLPDVGDWEKRAAISVTVDAPVGPISFTTTHLHWKLHPGSIRERQIVEVCDLVLRRRPKGGFPPILVGDFNAEPDSTEIRYVTGLQSIAGRSICLYDAWRYVRGGGNGITFSRENDYARPNLEPDRRIDYIFVGLPQRDGVGEIESCRVVCDRAKGGIWPSDHFGVYAQLRTDPVPELQT